MPMARLVETTGDCKEDPDFSYKKGFGYHLLVVSLASTQEVLCLENRSGNRPSHEGAALLPGARIRPRRSAGNPLQECSIEDWLPCGHGWLAQTISEPPIATPLGCLALKNVGI